MDVARWRFLVNLGDARKAKALASSLGGSGAEGGGSDQLTLTERRRAAAVTSRSSLPCTPESTSSTTSTGRSTHGAERSDTSPGSTDRSGLTRS